MSLHSSTNTTWEALQANRTSLAGLGNRDYRYFLGDWKRLLDAIEGGEREVKERGEEYLPKTAGQRANKQSGDDVYNAYKERAIFYGYSKDTMLAMLGVMHAKPAKIELPPALEELNKDADNPQAWRAGLQQVLREINRNQLTYGRYGILVDMPADMRPEAETIPKLTAYECFFILDWGVRELENGDFILDYVLLAEEDKDDERKFSFDDYGVNLRILALDGNGEYYTYVVPVEDDVNKTMNSLRNFDLDQPPVSEDEGGDSAVYPMARDKRLEFIPFVFVNTTDLKPDIEKSPLLQLTDMDISIYRGDADWAQAYFLQGQATPYVTGVSDGGDELFWGAGAFIRCTQADAKVGYAEVSGAGLGEMRERQEGLQRSAVAMGISLVDQNQPESGKALETRVGIKSASMSAIVDTGAKALVQALRYANFWKAGDMGINTILVEPNRDFTTANKTAKELLDLWTAKQSGAPISLRDINKWARDNGFTNKGLEETLEDIGEEG